MEHSALLDNAMTTAAQRNTPRDTWRWLWPDMLIRIIPFAIAGLVAAHFLGFSTVGLQAPPQGWPVAFAEGLAAGLVMMALAMIWRGIISPGYRLPTSADQALQTIFYLAINAPVEELFWRGTVQTLAILGVTALGANHALAVGTGIAATSAVFGAYHRLGGYPWRFNVAAMAAGAVFGLLFVALSGPSLVAAALAHGLTTAGYLSWGDVALHLRRSARRVPQQRAA
jgi:membrane protease YdiL (CAAX protease family)